MIRYEIGIYAPVLIVAMLLVYSCQTTKWISSQEKCKLDVKNFIADKWSYNPETKLYKEGKGMIQVSSNQFKLRDCLTGMDKESVIDVFGVPSRETKNGLFYFYYAHCFTGFDKSCLGYMQIELDSNKRFKSLGFGSNTTEH